MLNSSSIHLSQESFEIYQDDDDESSISGTIRDTEASSVHFLGQEKLGNEIHTLIDQVYSLQGQEFNLVIPNQLPPSIQLENGDGVYYSLRVDQEDQAVPVHLHTNTICDHDDKLFWGIIQTLWQYEIEFPSVYYFNQQENNISQACIRFKSLEGQQTKFSDCCLIGFQIIQSIHRKGYDTEYKVISMETRLLTDLNQTWNDPYLLTFNLSQDEESRLLPTTCTKNIEIQHDIKFTLAFTDPSNNLNFDFPITCIEDFPTTSCISSNSSTSSIITTLDEPITSTTTMKNRNSAYIVNGMIA